MRGEIHMAKEKISFEQFFETVEEGNKLFIHDLQNYLLESGCKVAFEEKKSGYLASYKFGKPPKALLNFVFRKTGMLARIYGEQSGSYQDFLISLPTEMIKSIEKAGDCRRLTENACNPKCVGYDFKIGDKHFQKCRYSCFEFLITDESMPFIKAFIERELSERTPVLS